MQVVVLGGTGMLGSMVADVLCRNNALEVSATARRGEAAETLRQRLPRLAVRPLDAERLDIEQIGSALAGAKWAINAIGVIKPYIHDDNAAEVERGTRVNALFPHLLAKVAEASGCRVLQIATDCVYSGQKGRYAEKDVHDALDVYGKTKSLGEVYSPAVFHLRASIIGPEPTAGVSLLHWFLKQPKKAGINGYTNHDWNGVTTLHFARLCQAVIERDLALPHVQHVVPSGTITKADLLKVFASEYNRGDLTITPGPAKVVVDRTLATLDDERNAALWSAAGYAQPPTVPQMVAEMAKFDYRLSHTPAGA